MWNRRAAGVSMVDVGHEGCACTTHYLSSADASMKKKSFGAGFAREYPKDCLELLLLLLSFSRPSSRGYTKIERQRDGQQTAISKQQQH